MCASTRVAWQQRFVELQGWGMQVSGMQGLELQGLGMQGLELQGLGLQGLGLQGLGSQGLGLQGLETQGLELQVGAAGFGDGSKSLQVVLARGTPYVYLKASKVHRIVSGRCHSVLGSPTRDVGICYKRCMCTCAITCTCTSTCTCTCGGLPRGWQG